MSSDLPIVVTAAGYQPTPPAVLRARLVALVAATNPDYTANLPGALIEDIASTDTGALTLIDQAVVELGNSLTPYGANEWLLIQLGDIYGVQQGTATRTSVNVIFTGTVSFIIDRGFTISDGAHQYTVQDGAVIPAGGVTDPVYCLATATGSWAVPEDTVTQLVTSIPSTITLSVNNPLAGTAGAGAQSATDYRTEVLQAGLAASQGMSRYLRTLLAQVSGVQTRLVSIRQQGDDWEIIVGGGDPYEVANAIFKSVFYLPGLVGSSINVVSFTRANPGVVTTDLNHGFASTDVVVIAGSTPSAFNGTFTVTVTDEKTFSVGVNTSGYASPYASGGVCTPNARNQEVTILDYPDTYLIPFVLPPEQTVTMTVTWNTTATNVVSASAIAQLAAPALADYVNSIYVGQPMNVFEMNAVFQAAVAPILPGQLLTRLVFAVGINGVGTSPTSGTGVISGDPESYMSTTSTDITVVQG